MSDWTMKRFWTDVAVAPEADGFSIKLDNRPVRTPAKRQLLLPNEAIANHVAAEWRAQDAAVDPMTMPWTRTANAAIDKVSVQRTEVMDHLASYAASDLLCYRAEGPASLVDRQADLWDPILNWVKHRFEAKLVIAKGIMPVDQPPKDLKLMCAAMTPMSDFQLTGFHDLVSLSGSFSIALAITEVAFLSLIHI